MNAGYGCCALKHPEVAAKVKETLLHRNGDRYFLIAWCIMPNHVHALIRTTANLSKIIQSWKSYTGRWALAKNAELGLGTPGPAFWLRDYWDRYIRDADHFDNVVAYIHRNPVSAGLVPDSQSFPWSSTTLEAPSPRSPRGPDSSTT